MDAQNTTPMKQTNKRRNSDERKKHFLNIWADDPELKAKMRAVARADGRSLSNYFNRHVVPIILANLDKKWEALPAEVKKKALAE